MSVTRLRCSSLDKLFDCPMSVFGTGMTPIGSQGGPARIGKVAHDLLADLVAGGDWDLAGAANRHALTEDEQEEVRRLVGYGEFAWGELHKYLPSPKVECALESDAMASASGMAMLDGTADVVSPVGSDRGVFVDWKSGWKDDGYEHQGFGYATCLWHALGRPTDGTITGVFVFLRHRYYRVVKYRPQDIEAWCGDLTRNVLARASRGEFSPGATCGVCDYFADCKARQRVAEGVIDTLLLGETHEANKQYEQWLAGVKQSLARLTDATLDDAAEATSTLYERIKLVERGLDGAKALLREACERHGRLPLGDGTELAITEQERKDINTTPALRVLRRHLSDAQIADCTKISLPKVLDAYGKQRQAGDRAAAKQELEESLEQAGAISVRRMTRMAVRRSDYQRESVKTSNLKDSSDADADCQHADGGRGDQAGGDGA